MKGDTVRGIWARRGWVPGGWDVSDGLRGKGEEKNGARKRLTVVMHCCGG